MPFHEKPDGARNKKGENGLNHKNDREIFDPESLKEGGLCKVVDQDAAGSHGHLYKGHPNEEFYLIGINPKDPAQENDGLFPLEKTVRTRYHSELKTSTPG